MKVLIAGCGFLGEAAAVLFAGRGDRVLGLCGSAASAERLVGRPFEVRVADICENCDVGGEWKHPDLLVHCVSSRGGGVEGYRRVYVQGLRNVLAEFEPRRLVYVGSTSVYGQKDGEWVTEESACEPEAETGRILLEAERLALEGGGCVLRLAGLYGPGRSVLLRKYLEGSATLDGDGGRWINQIHREDAARAVVAAAEIPTGIYNVCDDHPATQLEVYRWIAEACGGPLPPAGVEAAVRRRGNSNKRVSNARLRHLGWRPEFPSYREGLWTLLPTGGGKET